MIRQEHDWSLESEAKAFKTNSELRLIRDEYGALSNSALESFKLYGRGSLIVSPSYSLADLRGESSATTFLLDYLSEAELKRTAQTDEPHTPILDLVLAAMQTYEPMREFLVSFLEGAASGRCITSRTRANNWMGCWHEPAMSCKGKIYLRVVQ